MKNLRIQIFFSKLKKKNKKQKNTKTMNIEWVKDCEVKQT